MDRRVIYISLLLILTSFTTHTNQTQTNADKETPQTIALKKNGHLYFLPILLNNRQANLLIDTGAAVSLLDINQANDFDFEFRLQEEQFVGLGGHSTRYSIQNSKIHYNNRQLYIRPHGADLRHVVQSFSNNGIEIVGIVGSDFFRNSNAIIDYKNHMITIYN